MSAPLPPNAVIGMLGGGQLGRLMAIEAARLGFRVHTYSPEEKAPAYDVSAKAFIGSYTDPKTLLPFAESCDVITYEFENVPAECASILAGSGKPVYPPALALEKSQDRLIEKTFLNDIGVPTVAFQSVESLEQLDSALAAFGGQGVLKRRREGYDGKGQLVIRGDYSSPAASNLLEKPCILEAFCPFDLEISVVLARSTSGEMRAFDPPHNIHEDGILRTSILPAPISEDIARNAVEAAEKLAEALEYVGVLALEFFVKSDGTLVANEFAPRVHNSGHWTPEGCMTGQFEQHIRAVAGWPLGPQDRLFDLEMHNLLGEDIYKLPAGFPSDAKLVGYGKAAARPGRKMGHIVIRQRRTS